jgi:hypothetical protein
MMYCASQDGKEHGEGTYRYKDGSMYAGQWELGMKHGHGVYTYNDRRRTQYDGQWRRDQKEGRGVLSEQGGISTTYDGTWVSNKQAPMLPPRGGTPGGEGRGPRWNRSRATQQIGVSATM